MKKIKLILTAILIIYGITVIQAETLRGTVKDAITGEPLIGATVKIVEVENAAAVADLNGNYLINIKHGGRYTIEASYIGYEPNVMKEILISGAKEVLLDITLSESSAELNEVVVRPRVNKESTVNPTALVGGVMLSMEEANRFAGGINDPARLVSAFAGISASNNGNGVSVHGNAPQMMKYRMNLIRMSYPRRRSPN